MNLGILLFAICGVIVLGSCSMGISDAEGRGTTSDAETDVVPLPSASEIPILQDPRAITPHITNNKIPKFIIPPPFQS